MTGVRLPIQSLLRHGSHDRSACWARVAVILDEFSAHGATVRAWRIRFLQTLVYITVVM